ncbi:MAG TPA: hypothetical protein VEA35_05325 [Ramlibacter sp.]|nr:hypothetical protein [Ramlibacter sp.]
MIHRFFAALALAACAVGSAGAQTAQGAQSAVGASVPSAPSTPGSTFITPQRDAATDAAAGRAPAAQESVRPSGIDPAYQGMGARTDTVLVQPAMGAMYLNGRVDDVRKTCPPGTVRRDYRCAPAPDQMLRR